MHWLSPDSDTKLKDKVPRIKFLRLKDKDKVPRIKSDFCNNSGVIARNTPTQK